MPRVFAQPPGPPGRQVAWPPSVPGFSVCPASTGRLGDWATRPIRQTSMRECPRFFGLPRFDWATGPNRQTSMQECPTLFELPRLDAAGKRAGHRTHRSLVLSLCARRRAAQTIFRSSLPEGLTSFKRV